MAPFRSFVRRGNPRLFGPNNITESPVFTGLGGFKPAPFRAKGRSRITPVSGSFLARRAGYCRLEPPFGSCCLPAAAHLRYYYSGGRNGMHNVEGSSPGLCPGELDLSNTWVSQKTLSFSKPPRRESSFAAFLTVLDGKHAPGGGREGTLQGSVTPCSARFCTVPSEEAGYRPWEARFLSNQSRCQPALSAPSRCFLWARALQALVPHGDVPWPSRAKGLRTRKRWVL